MAIQPKYQYSDAAVTGRLGRGVTRTIDRVLRTNFITELVRGVFYFAVGLGAFSVRVVLRKKLGERSFGLICVNQNRVDLKSKI